MGSREDAARNLKRELDAQQKLRDDEKAWKAQHKNVEKATDAWRATFDRRKR